MVATLEKKKRVWDELNEDAEILAEDFIVQMGIDQTPFNRYFAKNCFKLIEGGWAKDPLPALKCLLDLAKTGKPNISETGNSVKDILIELIRAGLTPDALIGYIREIQREQTIFIKGVV